MREGVYSTPSFFLKHTGTVLVCGSAACLFDDLKRARSLIGNVPIIAVNGAAKLVPALALYSKHPERFLTRRWLEAQRFLFASNAIVHADVKADKRAACVDYWWSGLWGGGGSAWDARKLADAMGFDTVVLCGCPLIAGPHVGGLSFASFMHRKDIVREFQKQIESDTEWHEGCISMSGWTSEILGTV